MSKTLVSNRHLVQRLTAIAVLSAFIVLALSVAFPATALAASSSQAAGKCAKTDVACVIAVGDQDIAVRQTALTTLSNRITAQQNKNNITTDQANALQTDVATNSNGLAALKTKLDAETDATAARDDVKNIFVEFRIYAVVLPRDYHQIRVDIETNLAAKLQGLETQIQADINNAPSANQAQLNALFGDYENQVNAAQSQIQTATSDLATLTPANFNANPTSTKATLKAINAADKAAGQDLHAAGKDLNQIVKILDSGLKP